MLQTSVHLREQQEEWELAHLSARAAKSRLSRGREVERDEDPIRTAFQRDRDRILHSKPFRRLKDKTQVFIAPVGDHYRTRLTHTLEVCQVSRTIGRGLRLNEDLIEAISLGHDLGHPPFAHTGEHALSRVVPGGFQHNLQSLRVVEVLERMNLSWEVRDGIRNHTGGDMPATLEGQIVRVADRIAYLNHDIDDAVRAGILKPGDLDEYLDRMGATHGERIAFLVSDMIHASADSDLIRFSEPVQQLMDSLRTFMFRNVYLNKEAKTEEEKAEQVVRELYLHYVESPDRLEAALGREIPTEERSRAAVDYVAGMTDRFAIKTYKKLFLPAPFLGGDES